jgi:hypothetical protein
MAVSPPRFNLVRVVNVPGTTVNGVVKHEHVRGVHRVYEGVSDVAEVGEVGANTEDGVVPAVHHGPHRV